MLALGHLASGRFLSWYARVGFAEAVMAKGEDSERSALLMRLAETIDDRLIDYAGLMRRSMGSTSPEVSRAAVQALGRVGERMVKSVALMDRGEAGAAWPRTLLASLRAHTEPELLRLAVSGPLREEAVSALAGLQADEAFPLVVASLREAQDEPAFLRALIDLVRCAEPVAGLQALSRFGGAAVPGGDPDGRAENSGAPPARGSAWHRARVLWAAGRLVASAEEARVETDVGPLHPLVDGLETWGADDACIAMEALVVLRLGAARDALLALAGGPDERCAELHAAGPSGARWLLASGRRRVLVALEALAGIASGDQRIADALAALAARPGVASDVAATARRVSELSVPGAR